MQAGPPTSDEWSTRSPYFGYQTKEEHMGPLEQNDVRKTFKYKLMPTPAQERTLKSIFWHCRTLYNVALEQRRTWWGRGQGVTATYYQQAGELPALKAAY
jgi:hypothetical protein